MRIPDLNIIQPAKIASISVQYSDQQNAEYHICVLQKIKGKIILSERVSSLSSLEQVYDFIPKSTPVLLNISGKVVLNKHHFLEDKTSSTEQFFPANQKADFYCYEYYYEKFVGLSLCRKSIIDELTNHITKANYDIVGLSIGPYIVGDLWQCKFVEQNSIPISNGVIEINKEDKISLNYKPTNTNTTDSIQIGEEQLTKTEIIPFTKALSWYLKMQTGSFYQSQPENLVVDFQYKHIFQFLKFPALGLVLIILIINYLTFENHRKKDVLLEEQLSMNTNLITQLDSLEGQLKAKEKYISLIGTNRTQYSFLLDKIAATVPSQIVLMELYINPLVKSIKENEAIQIVKEIKVIGLSSTSLVLNEWTKDLANKTWVKDVVVLDYHKDLDKIKGEFIVQIKLKE